MHLSVRSPIVCISSTAYPSQDINMCKDKWDIAQTREDVPFYKPTRAERTLVMFASTYIQPKKCPAAAVGLSSEVIDAETENPQVDIAKGTAG
jgi:hypothetical protein